MSDVAENCRHGTAAPRNVIESLPDSQGGAARHKCVTCAFAKGTERAVGGMAETCKHGSVAPRAVVDALPDAQAGVGRHKCAICAYAAGTRNGAVASQRRGAQPHIPR